MNIVQVTNVFLDNGNGDYKGLDINKIVPGSQVYNANDNSAYFLYDGEVLESTDISIVTQSIYNSAKQLYKEDQPLSIEERIKELEETVALSLLGGAPLV
ncbi:hypothetical protein ACFRCQ_28095 [Cytobacillus firmus]|uniref:hypothetical protein n=1 Tax=Cytobacillus firmus TaxID=1399 RepID=UPI00368C10AA